MENDLIREYKPLEVDYNVQCAVENLKTAYWSNDYEKYSQVFTEADQMIVSAICHYDYTVCKQAERDLKRPQGEWIIIDRNEQYKTGVYKCNLCGYKNPVPDELKKNYCPNCGARMKGGAE